VLGGPIKKDKLFFFVSSEGLRVRQPQIANTFVPSLASRQNAPSAVQPLLNALPKPTGPDLGNGTAAFVAGYSDPSSLNSYSGRIDYLLSQRLSLFARYSDAPSSLVQRAGFAFRLQHPSAYSGSHPDHHRRGDETITSHTINEFPI